MTRQPRSSKKANPFSGANLNGAFCNIPAILLLIIFFRPGPAKSSIHQATSGRLIASESATTSPWSKIHQQALGQHQRSCGTVQRVVEEGVAGGRVGQVDGSPGQLAARRLVGKQFAPFPRATPAGPPPPR